MFYIEQILLLPIFYVAPSFGAGNIWIYLYAIYFLSMSTSLFTLKVPSLLSPSNDASVDIADD